MENKRITISKAQLSFSSFRSNPLYKICANAPREKRPTTSCSTRLFGIRGREEQTAGSVSVQEGNEPRAQFIGTLSPSGGFIGKTFNDQNKTTHGVCFACFARTSEMCFTWTAKQTNATTKRIDKARYGRCFLYFIFWSA